MTSQPLLRVQRPPQQVAIGRAPIPPNRGPQSQAQSRNLQAQSVNNKLGLIDLTGTYRQNATTTVSSYNASKLSQSGLKGLNNADVSSVHDHAVTGIRQASSVARGKPQLYFQKEPASQLTEGEERTSTLGPPHASQPSPIYSSPPPMPDQPSQYETSLRVHRTRGPVAVKAPITTDIALPPYILEPPPVAPRLSGDKHADFFPWMGAHPEDVLSEQVIRSGYTDKAQVTREELSARASLVPYLKPTSALRGLSSLFAAALRKRQALGRVTAPSTFKPPPRVTLTDTKREAWLRDLATPTVPLRKLSRTIPHGIRGKVLLDQCLSKQIPSARAVWLAKCVGANEIRGFRRKGASGPFALGGEVKWMRDWTLFVEQFVESVLLARGEKEWQAKITYALRVSTHLCSEHMLDREHFYDWILTCLESSSLHTLPVWLMLVRIHQTALMHYRKFGRRLAFVLLENFQATSTIEKSRIMAPLGVRLKLFIGELLQAYPHNLIVPLTWDKNRDCVRSSIGPDEHQLWRAYQQVSTRTERLSTANFRRPKVVSGRQRLLHYLDKLRVFTSIDEVSTVCLTFMADHNQVIHELLKWATSSFRTGSFRVYLAVRLLRTWRTRGTDTDEAILDFLVKSKSHPCSHSNLYLIIAELVRSRQFSIGHYLQWLIARGALQNVKSLNPDDPCEVRLLAELPLHGQTPQIINLRRLLLGSIGFSVDEEALSIHGAKGDALSGGENAFCPVSVASQLHTLSRTVQSELARYIRGDVAKSVTRGEAISSNNWRNLTVEAGISTLTVEGFSKVRDHLEQMEDLSILADVMATVSTSDDPAVLATVADTLSYHLDSFAAIGALEDILSRVLIRHRVLTTRKPTERCLLVSLMDLAARVPAQMDAAQDLRAEMQLFDQNSTVTVYSPVSDHTTDIMQTADADFNDEMERLLSGGTSMDNNTLERFFRTVTSRLELSWTDLKAQDINYGLLLSRLRSFESTVFDQLMVTWVEGLIPQIRRPELAQAFFSMIIVGSLSLLTIVATSTKFLENNERELDPTILAKVALEALQLVSEGGQHPAGASKQDRYRFKLQKRIFTIEYPVETLTAIRDAIRLVSHEGQNTFGQRLDKLLGDEFIMSTIQTHLVQDTARFGSCFISPLLQGSNQAVSRLMAIVDRILGASSDLIADDDVQYAKIAAAANDLALPVCRIKLQLMFKAHEPLTGVENDRQSLINALFHAIDSTTLQGPDVWVELLAGLDSGISRHICEQVEGRVLGTLACQDTAVDERYIMIIHATSHAVNTTPASPIATQLVSKLEECLQILSTDAMPPPTSTLWLHVILQLIVIHQPLIVNAHSTLPTHSNTGTSNTTSTQTTFYTAALDAERDDIQSRILVALCTLLIDPSIQPPIAAASISEWMFDVIAWLLDSFPDTWSPPISILRLLQAHPREERLAYLFGNLTSPTHAMSSNTTTAEESPELTVVFRGEKANKPSVPFVPRYWEILPEPTPHVGENDTSLSLVLFDARKSV